MSYIDLVNSTQADLVEVNSNFLHIGQEDRYPMDGNTLGYTSNALDIGSSTYKWAEIHVDNIPNTDIIQNTISLVSRVTLSVTSASLSFSGLNGDTDQIYLLYCFFDYTGGVNNIYIGFNDVSTGVYGWERIVGDGFNTGAARYVSQTSIGLYGGGTTTSDIEIVDIILYAKTGSARTALIKETYGGAQYLESIWEYGAVWNNTASTLTSVQISTNIYFNPNSRVELWTMR